MECIQYDFDNCWSFHFYYQRHACGCFLWRNRFTTIYQHLIAFRGLAKQRDLFVLNIHGSVHRESVSTIVQQDATMCSLLYFCKLLYMFRVVTPPIVRSTYNCNYSIWHSSNRLCYYLPPLWRIWNWIPTSPRYAPDDGWSHHPKHVEQVTEI